MELSSPYEQEAKKGAGGHSQELVIYQKTLPAGQIDPYILEIRRRLQEDIHARREREKRRRKVLVDQLRALESIEVRLSSPLRRLHRRRSLGFETRRDTGQSFASSISVRTTSGGGVVANTARKGRSQTESHRLRETTGSATSARFRRSDGSRRGENERLSPSVSLRESLGIGSTRSLGVRRTSEKRQSSSRHHSIGQSRRQTPREHRILHDHHSAIRGLRPEDRRVPAVDRKVTFPLLVELRFFLFDATFSLIPAKVWREWNALFVSDKPFFDDEQPQGPGENEQEHKLHAHTVLQEESLKLLDEGDFNEYRNMIGEWEPPQGSQSVSVITHIPPEDNPIFGYIVDRLHHLVHPAAEKLPPPMFPAFGLKIIVLGKSFAGKSTALKRYADGK